MTRAFPSALKTHYAQGTTTIARCWKATLTDGTIVAATTHCDPLVIGGITYEATQGYTPSDVESASDLSVDNLEVDGVLASPSLTREDIYSGRWDYALIEFFEVNWRDLTQGRNLIRKGRLGQVRAGRTMFTAELRGLSQHYSRRIIELTSQECRADLGDSRCTVDLTPWTVAGTVDSVTGNNKVVHDAARTEPDDWFTGGLLTFTSGPNRGLSFEVKGYTTGALTLFVAPPNNIVAADTPNGGIPPGSGSTPSLSTPDAYTVYAGCQKRFYQDCIAKFANGLNFQGEPHLPGPGVFGGPGSKMTPATVPSSPPPPGSPPPPPPAPTPTGTYMVTLPTPGAPSAPAPTTTDASGAATINALLAGAGTVIDLPSGTYMIGAPVVIPSGKTLEGASGAGVILKADNGYTGNMVELTSATGATVKNLVIDGNVANRSSVEGVNTANAIAISGGSGNTIQNVTFVRTPSYALWVFNSPGLNVKYNEFEECWQPIRIDGNNVAGTGTIEGNDFLNTNAFKSIQHIDAINTKSLTIKSNTFAGAGLLPATTHGFEGTWGNSIYIFDSDGYLVENNTVGANYWSSIVSGQNGTNATIQRNSFRHGAHGGTTGGLQSSWIEQLGSDSVTFTANVLVGGLSVGDTGGDHLTITYNNITVPVGGTGIDCNVSFKHGTVSHNTVTQEADARADTGIYLWNKTTVGTALSVTNNRVEGFDHAIGINNPGGVGTVYGLAITGNTFVADNANVWISSGITVDASCSIQSTSAPAPAPGTGTGGYPFGSRLVPYAAGAIAPSDTTASMDAFIQQQYNAWVANILKTTPTPLGSIPAGGYWVQFSQSAFATVSEGMGYGMLICALMAGYDPTAQTKFDGLLATVRAFPCANYGGALNMTELMSWRVNANGTDGGGAWPALDGDLDIALALLMADRQWGSSGTWDYRAIALAMIPQIKSYAFNGAGVVVETSGAMHEGRTSDYMFGHFRAFKAATGDAFWDDAVTQQKRIVDYMQRNYAPATGLLPDWVGGADTATPFLTTSVNDGGNPHENAYWYNACRDPWRIGSDYVLTGDADLKAVLSRMSSFFVATTGGVVTNIRNGYALDGTGLVAANPYYIGSEFYNPMMVGALCDSRFQAWVDALWTYSKAHPETGYYGTEIQLLSAIVASGNWWTP